MKWSKNDVARFSATFETTPGFSVDKVDGNNLWYSFDGTTKRWKLRARLTHGGVGLIWSVHLEGDDSDLFES